MARAVMSHTPESPRQSLEVPARWPFQDKRRVVRKGSLCRISEQLANVRVTRTRSKLQEFRMAGDAVHSGVPQNMAIASADGEAGVRDVALCRPAPSAAFGSRPLKKRKVPPRHVAPQCYCFS